MYRTAHPEGAVFREWRIRAVVPAEDQAAQADTVHLDGSDVGVYRFVLDGLVRNITGSLRSGSGVLDARAEAAIERIGSSAIDYLPYQEFQLIIEEREFEVGRRGVADLNPPWIVSHTWNPGTSVELEAGGLE
jgi:hypothetical protein